MIGTRKWCKELLDNLALCIGARVLSESQAEAFWRMGLNEVEPDVLEKAVSHLAQTRWERRFPSMYEILQAVEDVTMPDDPSWSGGLAACVSCGTPLIPGNAFRHCDAWCWYLDQKGSDDRLVTFLQGRPIPEGRDTWKEICRRYLTPWPLPETEDAPWSYRNGNLLRSRRRRR